MMLKQSSGLVPEGVITEITRDNLGKPLSIKRRDAGNAVSLTRSYTYNNFQELCSTAEPELGTTLSGYDGAGNVKWTAAGVPGATACETDGTSAPVLARRVLRSYDARNRLQAVNFPDGRGDQTWTYTATGQPETISVSNPHIVTTVTTYGYHRRGLLKNESVFIHGSTYSTGYSYDGNASLLNLTYPSGFNVAFAPDALGRAKQAGSYASNVSYYPNGTTQQFSYGNGVVRTMLQNARQLPGRSTDCAVAGSSCSVGDMRTDLSYTYDAVGNVATITDGIYGRQTRTMTYDGLDRLSQTTSNMFGTASYVYDVLDNITLTNVSGGSSPRSHAHCYDGSNRLTAIRSGHCGGTLVQALSYDVQGNLSNKAGQSYVFDFGNRLRDVYGREWYAYDGHGRRVLSCNGSACAHFVYNKNGQLLYTHDARNNKRTEHVYLAGKLVALRERPIGSEAVTEKYQHTDALGTPIAVTAANKSFISKHEYEPFGLQVNGTLQDGPGYTGHVQDAATGLTYMQQRYYDPIAGRFLSVDPVVTDANTGTSFGRYHYAGNNPFKNIDPDGRNDLLGMV